MRVIRLLFVIVNTAFFAQTKSTTKAIESLPFDAGTVASLSFRMVGPALTSGRVIDLAIDPANKDHWFVAAASGGVWVTKIMELHSSQFLMDTEVIRLVVLNLHHPTQIQFGLVPVKIITNVQ